MLLRSLFTLLLPLVALPLIAAESPKAAASQSPWVDKRLPADERAVLAAVEGFAPPELPATATIAAGDFTSFDALRGKVVVVQSWSVKTEAGRAPLQRIPALLKDFNTTDVQIVFLHTPDGADKAADYLAKQTPPAPVIVDSTGNFCDDLGIYKRPVTMLIDRNGGIRAAGVSITALPGAVKELAAEPFDPASKPPKTVPSRDQRESGAGDAASDAPAPEFPAIAGAVGATDLRGKKGPAVSVQKWMSKAPETEGKVVMIEFWATWCGPCKRSIPHLNELHEKYSDKLAIVGISDEDQGKIRSFMKSTRFEYAVASDPSRKIMNAIKPQGIPHAIIMSPDGVVRWQGNPLALEEATVKQIIDASRISSAGGTSKLRWVSPATPEKPGADAQ